MQCRTGSEAVVFVHVVFSAFSSELYQQQATARNLRLNAVHQPHSCKSSHFTYQ